jgi:DNA-directed RNA polymerase subunit RPC12/RpoP
MPLDVKCPDCGSELEAPDAAAGKRVKCPDCGARIPVPGATEAIQPGPAHAAAERPAPAGDDEAVRQERPRRPRREDEEEDDDRPRRRRRRDEEDDEEDRRPDAYEDDAVTTLIPYKNGKALAAYYVGVFSLIPCLGLILGPIALILGIMGLRFVAAHPKAKGTGHAWAGVVLGTLTTLGNWGIVIVGVAAGILGAAKH